MAQWVNLVSGVPLVRDFLTTEGQGTPICIDVNTGLSYYLAAGDVVTQVGSGGGLTPLTDGSIPPNFIQFSDGKLVMVGA